MAGIQGLAGAGSVQAPSVSSLQEPGKGCSTISTAPMNGAIAFGSYTQVAMAVMRGSRVSGHQLSQGASCRPRVAL
jgi:hypothetical protein